MSPVVSIQFSRFPKASLINIPYKIPQGTLAVSSTLIFFSFLPVRLEGQGILLSVTSGEMEELA